VTPWTIDYRVARTFELGGRTFHRGEVLSGDDPDVAVLLRIGTLLNRRMLLVRARDGDRPHLSNHPGARSTVAWRMQERRHT
jgi:hypothetical protein